ncbi:hypothetical protein [Aliikangiella sp. G2MR2-5]|uniref:hypothetical protein n=1 Tax=Aliikangiella sp. G2MR2-5 TaxID=2788943 RepID=UPI0018AABAFC|nr:hypothetical protein [Aliikangiella sp. G2MR2-5]
MNDVSHKENSSLQSSAKAIKWTSFSSKYLFEFFIVFLGVYLAFLFTDYQEALREKKIRIKYYESLIFEFEGFNMHLKAEGKKLEESMKLVKRLKAGEQPALELTDFYYLYNGIAVRTAFHSENFAAIDQGLLKSIIGGIYQLELLEKKINRMNELQQAVLLPFISQDKSFYTKEGKLVDQLSWYPDLIEDIYNTNKMLQQVVKQRAIPDMQKGKTYLEQMPYWMLSD